MKALTLRQLRYFEALSRHLHFGRAAEACAVTQPAMSQQIRELEAAFGAPLVERGPRRVRLTTLGQDLLERARVILLEVDELSNLVRAADGPLTGRLRLGVIPTIAPYFLPRIMTTLAARLPQVEIEAREAVTRSLIGDLREARLDVAVLALPISEPALREFALFEEDFVLVRPASEAALPVPAPTDLATMRLLLLEEGHCFRDQALAVCAPVRGPSGGVPRTVMEGSSLSTLVQMVGAGLGVTLIPEMATALETRTPDVAIARFATAAPRRTVGLVWRRSNPLEPQLMQTGAILRQAAQGVPQRQLR